MILNSAMTKRFRDLYLTESKAPQVEHIEGLHLTAHDKKLIVHGVQNGVKEGEHVFTKKKKVHFDKIEPDGTHHIRIVEPDTDSHGNPTKRIWRHKVRIKP